jgi:hypothetical protein
VRLTVGSQQGSPSMHVAPFQSALAVSKRLYTGQSLRQVGLRLVLRGSIFLSFETDMPGG